MLNDGVTGVQMTDHEQRVPVALGAVNVEADDPEALARFWAEVLGGTVETSTPEMAFVAAREPGGFAMFFGGRTGARPDRQSQHLDLTVPWGSRADEVARVVSLGATHRWDVLDEVPWVQWSTLADPEGNLFCIAEHPPTVAGATHP
jgi:predicted enzyme related to lactoylglutathione lyase